ncbi:uncharacterized protein LOC130721016 [Lotus japonicus]|uniref:uncharacterized protein LOC130721016 n=1 Tax=Lotus japonicus TaxID=34305 RepID=UPI00258E28E3|nr:uncharacterized protein LOC130721016 [Lotus japonicus]
MDCTYKTSKYKLPLLEIVGLTSTDKTYSIEFCYIGSEATYDYIWALECMKSLIADQSRLPTVIVTDRDLALLKVMEKWANLLDASTVEEFEGLWMELFKMCKDKYRNFITYCSTTWAEDAHASLKRMLRNSKGDLATSWDASHSLTMNRHTEIVASFERSINRIDHIFKTPFYINIRGFVSNKCLQLIDAEQTRTKLRKNSIKSNHTLTLKESKPPKGQAIGSLTRDPSGFEHVDMEIKAAKKASQAAKKASQPAKKVHNQQRGRTFLHPYIDGVTNVEDDGNCGYRSIAALLRHSSGEDGWPWVRASLIGELDHNRLMYESMWSGQIVTALHDRLTLPYGDPATPDKWMQLPEIGYIMAKRFQVVFITFSSMGCNTYLPLRGAGLPDVHSIIAIGHVINHFIHLHLTPGHPMLPFVPQWQCHANTASKY